MQPNLGSLSDSGGSLRQNRNYGARVRSPGLTEGKHVPPGPAGWGQRPGVSFPFPNKDEGTEVVLVVLILVFL